MNCSALGWRISARFVLDRGSIGMAYVRLALLDGRVAVGIRYVGFFATAGHDEAVDEAQKGDCA